MDLVALRNSAGTFSRFTIELCKLREPGARRIVTTVGLCRTRRKEHRHGRLLFSTTGATQKFCCVLAELATTAASYVFGLLAYRFLPAGHVIYFVSMTISVLLADDSEIMRKAIVDLLKGVPEIEVVAESVGFAQTIRLAAKLHPQVIVLDVHMSDERTVTRAQLKSGLEGSRLLAISVWNDDQTKYLAEAIGAAALLDKTKLTAELIPAIRHLANESSEPTLRSD
jgi:CheY-like chemotaxis protein